MIVRALLLAFLLLFAPAAVAAPSQGDADWLYRGSDIERDPAWIFGTLDNGLRYAVRRNPLPAGQVSIRVRIDAGGLHEEAHEQGWAHFVEHMLFRGTESFPDRRAREIWQELGASFGSDSNATTSLTQTVYQLDLPRNDREALDTSLHVLAEMMMAARFDPAAVEGERRVVLAERERMPELTMRLGEALRPLFYAGLRMGERSLIGTPETLGAADAEGLRAFYRRWYRPERATVLMVGDADPREMAALIAARFGGWRGEGPAPADPDPGAIAAPPARVDSVVYPDAPASLSVAWLRPAEDVPHTRARERELLAEALATRIINRRLEAHARGEASAYVGAGIGTSRARHGADTTTLSLTARDGRWAEGLAEAFAILADARAAPPSESEIARELENLRTGGTAAVEGDATVRSPVRAQQLLNAIDAGGVIATPAHVLENFEENARAMTPDRVGEAIAALFNGEGPRMLLLTPEPVAGGTAAIEAALAAAERAAPAVRAAERSVGLDALPDPGPPGRELSREEIADMGVTIVRFANGASLTFKRTEHERGSVRVALRFGEGLSGLSPTEPNMVWAAGMVAASGIGDLDQDALERMLTGRRMGIAFQVAEDSYVLAGQTNAADLEGQLRLLVGKLIAPRWDAPLFRRYQTAALQNYPLAFATAAARAAREFPGLARPGDARWAPVSRERIAEAGPDDLAAFFGRVLAEGPVNVVIVGDAELEAAVAAVARTAGALPARPEAPPAPGSRDVRPPRPNPVPAGFTHEGDPGQAHALIGWSTGGGGVIPLRDRRALGLASNIFRVRLFDRLREAEGTTYSPSTAHSASEIYPAWGIFHASAEVRPENIPAFFRAAREIVADLAANPVAPDEFARAHNPVMSGIARQFATNAYWFSAIENFAHDARAVENRRTLEADYRSLTAEDVQRVVAAYVADEGDWSMQVLPARAAEAQ